MFGYRVGIRAIVQAATAVTREYKFMLYSHKSMKCGAFTILELLVVMTIIAMMISLLVPALSRARSVAQRVQCATNLRSIGQAIRIYAANNRNRYPVNSQLAPTGFERPFQSMVNGLQANGQLAPAGLGLLYTTDMITDPTMFYCSQPGFYGPYCSVDGEYLPALVKKGGTINWSNVAYGYCYYYQIKQSIFGRNPNTYNLIQFTQTPIDSGASILAGDLTANWVGNWNWPGPLPVSNHLVSTTGQPDGGNTLYNDGSVSWKNLNEMHLGYSWLGIMNFYQ